MAGIENLITDVSEIVGVKTSVLNNIFITFAIIVGYIVLRYLLNWLLEWYVKDVSRSYMIRKLVTHLLGFIVIIIILKLWIVRTSGALAYLGILSAGLAIALQDPLVNLAGWVFILARHPFRTGDRIEINNIAGDVIDVRLFQFSLMEIGNWIDADQSTGRIVHIPNGWVFKHAIANYTVGFKFIWHEIPVMVTFESNWKKAKQILQTIADEKVHDEVDQARKEIQKTAKKYMVFYTHLKSIVWLKVADSGVVLTIRFLCDPRKRRSTETYIWEKILEQFALENDIDFAYPTQRFYNNKQEGKPGAGGPCQTGNTS